jgi:3-dehydroquinate synthase
VNTLIVEASSRTYPIFIGSGLLKQRELFAPLINGQQVCVVSNETVAPLYADRLKNTLRSVADQNLQVSMHLLPDGEQFKTLTHLETIFDFLLKEHCDRSCTLIALGGGVVGDMTGFAAASYQRGIEYLQVPTTLLAQVDSSVGGKTAVNHPLGKNMIGAFHQPRAVVIDLEVLASLPPREYAAGLAEVIKYGAIADADFFDWLEINMVALNKRDPDALAYAIERSCQNKADIVKQDERESGLRALLNFGHTFAHAIETELGYGSWLHGEAVAAGMLYAAKLSEQLLGFAQKDVSRLEDLLVAASLPVKLGPAVNRAQILKHMLLDKKNLSGARRMILLQRIGHAVITPSVTEQQILRIL